MPKVQPVTSVADFRPISVTSVFSRITERLVVRDYFIPYIPNGAPLRRLAAMTVRGKKSSDVKDKVRSTNVVRP